MRCFWSAVEVTADNRQKVGRRRGHKTILGNAVAAPSLMKLPESPGVSWAAAANARPKLSCDEIPAMGLDRTEDRGYNSFHNIEEAA